MTSSNGKLSAGDFRAFALRERYLYFKVLAYGVSPVLCIVLKALKITPNQVTLAGIALVVPAVFFNLTGHVGIGIIIFHLFFVLDATDGILARATNKKSKLGAYLDDMAHHMFHVPFLLSMAYSEYAEGSHGLAMLLVLFAIANTLHRAQLDVCEKSELIKSGRGSHEARVADSALGRTVKDIVLGSFNFPNVLLWMTLLLWSSKLMTIYLIYAVIMTVLYFLYLFMRALRVGSAECQS